MITGEYEPEEDARIILNALDGLINKNVLVGLLKYKIVFRYNSHLQSMLAIGKIISYLFIFITFVIYCLINRGPNQWEIRYTIRIKLI